MRGLCVVLTWLVVSAVTITSQLAGRAMASPVKGTVVLPQELKSARRFRGYWRIENGIVPTAPLPARGDTVVVLTGVKGAAPAARTVTVDIAGLAATPPTVVLGEGSVVEIKNSDRVAHDLSIPDMTSLMPLERLAPGSLRRQKMLTAGGYAVRDAEYPHYAMVDDKGGFKLPDAPDGRATLKVWSQGRWVHEQAVDVGPKSDDLRIKVPQASDRSEQAPE
jgi:hypothetical protein